MEGQHLEGFAGLRSCRGSHIQLLSCGRTRGLSRWLSTGEDRAITCQSLEMLAVESQVQSFFGSAPLLLVRDCRFGLHDHCVSCSPAAFAVPSCLTEAHSCLKWAGVHRCSLGLLAQIIYITRAASVCGDCMSHCTLAFSPGLLYTVYYVYSPHPPTAHTQFALRCRISLSQERKRVLSTGFLLAAQVSSQGCQSLCISVAPSKFFLC